jgi:hypothetical protein
MTAAILKEEIKTPKVNNKLMTKTKSSQQTAF